MTCGAIFFFVISVIVSYGVFEIVHGLIVKYDLPILIENPETYAFLMCALTFGVMWKLLFQWLDGDSEKMSDL